MHSQITRYQCLIGGTWRPSSTKATFASTNPYTGATEAFVPDCAKVDVDDAVAAAREAFEGPWRDTTAVERGRLLRRLADLIVRDADKLAEAETRDNGKLYREMHTQCQYAAEWFRYYASAIETHEGSVIPSDRPNFLVYTTDEPIGVVAAITPWNSPLLLLSWKLAPALAAGCTMVAKPSEYTPVSTLLIAELVEEAGFPPGVFNVVTGGPTVGQSLCANPDVDKIAFTGATDTGAAIAASAAEHHTRVTLELGGKSPNIVFPDCDLESAVNGVLAGIFAATGQSCMAGSRLLVHEEIYEELLERLVARAAAIRAGDPMEPDTEIGPAANEAQRDKINGLIQRAVDDGATLACGGPSPIDAGPLFVQPTILTNVAEDAEICHQEVFGPVLSVLRFRDEAEAVRIANNTRFGLAAAVWTQNVHRAHRMTRAVRAGTVWVNAYRTVSFAAPFGGFGASGSGRENGRAGLEEYTETKAVWIELSGQTRDPFNIG